VDHGFPQSISPSCKSPRRLSFEMICKNPFGNTFVIFVILISFMRWPCLFVPALRFTGNLRIMKPPE
ncbi:MAG: hypothetical protein IK127_05575, partial [Clostridia bacterium]|nr:hypothetical protein [Clostridia bacterium]